MAFNFKKIIRGGLTGGGTGRIADPLKLKSGLDKKKPKEPEKTAQEAAAETRQRRLLDEEIAEQEKRLKAIARGKLGFSSLLSGAEATREALAGRRGGAGAGAGSLLGGVSGGAVGGGGVSSGGDFGRGAGGSRGDTRLK